MLKALDNMHLILSYQIGQPTITVKFYILKSIRRKLKCFTNSLAFFTMFRYALVEDKTMHIAITFRFVLFYQDYLENSVNMYICLSLLKYYPV